MKDFFEGAFDDDLAYGGTQIMVFGSKGSGKSMLLSMWALKDLERGHTIIWRGKDVDTWTIFSHRAKVRVIVPYEGYRIVREDRKGNEIPLENTEVIVCPRPDDAVSLLKKGTVNVILVECSSPESESLWWTIFARTLNHSSMGWVTLCIDEINDIFESNPRGDLSQIHKKFKDAFASFRKKKIHVRASAHIYHDINYEISYKFKYSVYMRGAILLPKKRTSLRYPTIIRKLEEYQGILDDGAQFSIFDYDPLPHDVATQETVRFEGPSWSMNDYPSLMLSVGLHPRVECPDCEKNIRLRDGIRKCPFCGSLLIVRDIYDTPSGRSTERENKNEPSHGSRETSQVDPLNVIDPLDPMNTPVRMDMTKEEIFDLMLEKMIKTDQKITPNMRKVMEHISELTVEEIRKKGIKKGDWDTDQQGWK